MNISMQGQDENILTSTDKILALQRKIGIWKHRAEKGNFEMFPPIPKTHTKETVALMAKHLATLDQNIQHYFPSLTTEKYDWVRNPFTPDS
jgi:hypothetical protein